MILPIQLHYLQSFPGILVQQHWITCNFLQHFPHVCVFGPVVYLLGDFPSLAGFPLLSAFMDSHLLLIFSLMSFLLHNHSDTGILGQPPPAILNYMSFSYTPRYCVHICIVLIFCLCVITYFAFSMVPGLPITKHNSVNSYVLLNFQVNSFKEARWMLLLSWH